MRCFNDYLDTPIREWPSLVGVRGNASLVLRSAITAKVINGAVCSFGIAESASYIPVYMPGDLPYAPTSSGEKNARGLQKFNKTVEFFFVENTNLSHVQIQQLKNEAWVIIFLDNNNCYQVFGLESGLRLMSTSQDFNSTDTHGGIVATMQESNANTSMLFAEGVFGNLLGISSPLFEGTAEEVGVDEIDFGSTIVFDPTEAPIKTIYYTSSNPDYIAVDSDGIVESIVNTGLATATITATSLDGGHTCEMEVVNDNAYHVSKFYNAKAGEELMFFFDSTAFLQKPNGTIVQLINAAFENCPVGWCKVIFAKANAYLDISYSFISGSFKTLFAGTLCFGGLSLLTDLSAPKSIYIDAQCCAFTVASLETLFTEILTDIVDHSGAEDRTIDVSGTGNAIPNTATLGLIDTLAINYGCLIMVNS